MSTTMDPINCAMRGDVEYFKTAPLADIRTARDNDGDSVFSIAVKENQLECCKEIYRRCPSLLYHQSDSQLSTAVQHAAWRGDHAMVEFLISADNQKDYVGEETDTESRQREGLRNLNVLTMVDIYQEIALHKAVLQQKPQVVKLLVEADPGRETLRMVDSRKDTALHMAVANHNFEIVTMLIEADPEFRYGVNTSGVTPLVMAMEKARSDGGANSSGKIRKLLLEKQSNNLKEQMDNGWTLLHYAAHKGDLSSIEEIIGLCPDCMEVVDDEGRNFLHLAAKENNVEVVKHVLGTKQIPPTILNKKDNYGNTPLHAAALSGYETSALCLLYDGRVKKTTRNNKGQAVLDAITFDYDEAKAEVFGITDRMSQNQWKNQSDFDLIVGALIGAVSFTAGLTIPGGYISDGPNRGTAVLAKQIPFVTFVISNNFGLMFSLYAVICHFCTRHLRRKEDVTYYLKVAHYCTLAAIFAMLIAFFAGSYAVLANSKPLAITGCLSCFCFVIFASYPIRRMFIIQHIIYPC